MTSFLVSQPASDVATIIAAVRKSSDELEKIAKASNGRIIVLHVQVTDEEDVQRLSEEVAKVLPDGLDVLINNAGIMHYSQNAELGIQTM